MRKGGHALPVSRSEVECSFIHPAFARLSLCSAALPPSLRPTIMALDCSLALPASTGRRTPPLDPCSLAYLPLPLQPLHRRLQPLFLPALDLQQHGPHVHIRQHP